MKLINLNTCIQQFNTEEILKLLKSSDPDIITLQEVTNPKEDSVFEQYRRREIFKKELGKSYKYEVFGPEWKANKIIANAKLHTDFGGMIEQGNEMFSKYPILNSSNEFFYKSYEHIKDWSRWVTEDHGRAVIVSEIRIGNKTLQILNTHGIWTKDKMGDERTIKECKYILKKALEKKLPTIITGDFNLYPETESIKIFDKDFRNLIKEYKIKTTRPEYKENPKRDNNVCDYIFVNDLIDVLDFKIIDTEISDHLPLYLEFNIK